MKRLLCVYFWWPAMDRMADQWARECPQCRYSENMFKVYLGPLVSISWPKNPRETVVFDILGPLHSLPVTERDAVVNPCHASPALFPNGFTGT